MNARLLESLNPSPLLAELQRRAQTPDNVLGPKHVKRGWLVAVVKAAPVTDCWTRFCFPPPQSWLVSFSQLIAPVNGRDVTYVAARQWQHLAAHSTRQGSGCDSRQSAHSLPRDRGGRIDTRQPNLEVIDLRLTVVACIEVRRRKREQALREVDIRHAIER